MKFDNQICPENSCTGCFACMNACPSNAISVGLNESGATVPVIDKRKCIKCGLCMKTCPSNFPVLLSEPEKCYAAQRPEKQEREMSASGGVASALAEFFISIGGCVFGAAVVENGHVAHICAETREDVDRLRNSKYVQSEVGYSYSLVKEKLSLGKYVLFTGTPCQIAGLKRYLKKDYERLYCADLICHGVPPMRYLEEHYKQITGDASIDVVTFRDPKIGYCLKVSSGMKMIYASDRFHDLYFHAFFRALSCRENCYQCTYARPERCSDITLGDFWGIDRKTLTKITSGYISLVLVNSQKGEELIDRIKGNITFEERDMNEAICGNAQLQHPSNRHQLREQFLKEYRATKNFDAAVENIGLNKEMRKEKYENYISTFFRKARHKLVRMFGNHHD